ncbi:hypothetical protein CFP65_0946 [Kitasatospora sp. MMS16-BH015]|uniref:hypothetical protein n=1 Tax=Kitasatospora sp. MMS16-BH015 TaxID=2018025 RepID=UPI000CA11650|nr:hypothetical protein [Kitasatospora sp. MMS16-BH015]AUG75865.1 hypothetical protein CFP65_0946 [Kitasatospora sp. MMS16-BH015]
MSALSRGNSRLRLLLGQAGLSGSELARAVNRLGLENGLELHYQRASVGQWLAGTRPRRPVPELIAEALSRRLGRRVTVEEAGLTPPGPAGPRADGSESYRLAAVEELLGSGRRRGGAAVREAERVGARHVRCLDRMTAHFSRTDHLVGSGHSVGALTGFFAVTVRGWLAAPASPAVQRGLAAAGARLAYLGGFLHVDQRRHGPAQQWYRLAVELAEEAGDPRTLSAAYRALSVQAHQLGHRAQAARLAERAVVLGTGQDPSMLAFLYGQRALTLAADGRRREVFRVMGQAERHLDWATGPAAAGPAATVVGAYHPAALAHQRGELRYQLGDLPGAVTELALSDRLRPAAERRSRALVLARTGELLLAAGAVDGACAAWQQFVELGAGLASRRLDHAYAGMRTALARHRGSDRTALLSALRSEDWPRSPEPL